MEAYLLVVAQERAQYHSTMRLISWVSGQGNLAKEERINNRVWDKNRSVNCM
jgi:hypothetical protein